MLKIKVIVGSTRKGRFSETLVPWVTKALDSSNNVSPEVLDLRDYDMPFYEESGSPSTVENGQYPNEIVRTFAEKIADADAFLIIAPEYNHGYSAVLKNALDSVYGEWNKKAVGFVSYGSVGGGRAVEQLRQVAVELQMAPIRSAVHIQAPWFLRDESGALKEGALEGYDNSLKGTIEQLVWWGNALKEARTK
jgi:NAD(P)H-dependent FMN reductase